MDEIITAVEMIDAALAKFESGGKSGPELVEVVRSLESGLAILLPAVCSQPMVPGKIGHDLRRIGERLGQVLKACGNELAEFWDPANVAGLGASGQLLTHDNENDTRK